MRICVYGDVHWSTYSSIVRSRGTEYSTRLENLIRSVNWAEEKAEKNNCDAVVCLGDFFDRPDLNAEELSALLRIKWAKGSVKEHFFIVGNHESTVSTLEYNSTNALNNDGFVIVDKPQRLISYKTDVLFLPYILEEDRKSITDYWNSTEEPNTFVTQEVKNRIIFSHNDLKNVQYGAYTSIDGFDLADIEINSDLFINGHIHNGMFINERESILNLGILSGQNFGEDAYKHPHFACILDTETLQLDFFENPHAFNFYKVEIAKERDLQLLTRLKNNAIITIRCEESLIDKTREMVASLSNIIEHRIISYKDIKNSVDETEIKQSLNITDHLSQFYNFILTNIDSSVVSPDILKEELNKVVM